MKPRRCRMRDPFDDPVFRAFAAMHGVRREDMPADAPTRGWDCSEHGLRRGVPDGFPYFTFQAGSRDVCAVLAMDLGEAPRIRYAQAAYRYVHMDAGMLGSTVAAALAERPIRDVIEVPGLPDMIIDTVQETAGTLSLRLKERRP